MRASGYPIQRCVLSYGFASKISASFAALLRENAAVTRHYRHISLTFARHQGCVSAPLRAVRSRSRQIVYALTSVVSERKSERKRATEKRRKKADVCRLDAFVLQRRVKIAGVLVNVISLQVYIPRDVGVFLQNEPGRLLLFFFFFFAYVKTLAMSAHPDHRGPRLCPAIFKWTKCM